MRRLVLAATATGSLMVPADPRVLAKMLTPRRHRDPDYARSIAGEIYGGTMRTHPERAAQALHSATRLGPRRGYYYQLAASTGWSSLPFLRLIRQPTLLVMGDDDPIIPAVNARIMARLLPDARLHLYRGGHIALITEADRLAPGHRGLPRRQVARPAGVPARLAPKHAVRGSASDSIVGFTVLAVVGAVIWSAIAGGGIRALPLFVAPRATRCAVTRNDDRSKAPWESSPTAVRRLRPGLRRRAVLTLPPAAGPVPAPSSMAPAERPVSSAGVSGATTPITLYSFSRRCR